MALSEKSEEDKKKVKSGVIGVVVLLVLGSLGPVMISEFTGVDVTADALCADKNDDGDTTDAGECLDGGEFEVQVIRALGYVSYAIAIVGFVALVVVGVKY